MSEQDNNRDSAQKSVNAVSLFSQGGDAMDEFPVLKAFQQYIDAEQSKARKRMLGLSIFFVSLLVVVVVAFAMVLIPILNSKEQMSERFLEMALRQQQLMQPQPAAPVVVNPVQPVAQRSNDDLKPLADQIAALASALKSQQEEANKPKAPARPAVDPEKSAMTKEIKDKDAALAAEKAKLKDLEKRLHDMEVERQQRRNYPEYYEKIDREAAAAAAPATAKPSPLSTLKPYKPSAQSAREYEEEQYELAATRKSSRRGAAGAPKGTVNQVMRLDSEDNGTISWHVAVPE